MVKKSVSGCKKSATMQCVCRLSHWYREVHHTYKIIVVLQNNIHTFRIRTDTQNYTQHKENVKLRFVLFTSKEQKTEHSMQRHDK